MALILLSHVIINNEIKIEDSRFDYLVYRTTSRRKDHIVRKCAKLQEKL